MIPGFLDMDKFMDDFRSHEKCDNFINIMKLLNIETLTNGAQHAIDMSAIIVHQHISEPLFRILMLHIFYAKYPDIKAQVLKCIRGNESSA